MKTLHPKLFRLRHDRPINVHNNNRHHHHNNRQEKAKQRRSTSLKRLFLRHWWHRMGHPLLPLVRPLAVRDDRHHRLLLGTHRRRTRHGFRRLENLLAVLQKVESNLLRQPISRESVDLPLPKRRIP
jgi:hypothetical protein